MKTGIFIAAFWATVALSCANACAQDANRVAGDIQGIDAVDASVHSEVIDRALQEPQSSMARVKPPTIYSRWAFSTISQPLATRYWPPQTIISTSTAAQDDGERPSTLSGPSFQAGAQVLKYSDWSVRSSDPTGNLVSGDNSGKIKRQPGLFNNLSNGGTQNGLTGPQRHKTIVPSLSTQPQADGFSTPFSEMQFGSTNDGSSLPLAFPNATFSSHRDRGTASRRKSHPKKSLGSKKTSVAAGFPNGREKPNRSPLATKAN
jgi:hypothetical protein